MNHHQLECGNVVQYHSIQKGTTKKKFNNNKKVWPEEPEQSYLCTTTSIQPPHLPTASSDTLPPNKIKLDDSVKN